jgi:S-adenosylmethionine hydrolase
MAPTARNRLNDAMQPVITLTTDFGQTGPFVGLMKGVILRHAPTAAIVDLTHQVARFQPSEAGFWLARSYRHFPRGTVHVAVVDPGVGTPRLILAAAHEGHTFLAHDNGILPVVLPAGVVIHSLSPAWQARQGWPAPSNTFHGRDIFAPLAAAIASGRAHAQDVGPVATSVVPASIPVATRSGTRIEGCVVALDTWGNLITNIDASLLEGLTGAVVTIAGREVHLVSTYGLAAPGSLMALVNSLGVVEVAWREGSAAVELDLGRGAPVTVRGSS